MTKSVSDRVTIVSVCYNSMTVLPAMLGSVPAGIPIVLVDNASADIDDLTLLARERGARLIQNDTNIGFGAACNQGAALARTEFVLFLNPDAQLMPDTIERLLAAAERYPDASAMNPRIAEADGSAYFKRHSHLMPRSEVMPRGWPDGDCEVTVLSGAAMFVRRADFDAVGGFDPEIFLYHEDDDLSRRLRAERGPIMFIRDALVQHLSGRSTARTAEVAALKAWHMGRSRVYAARKHGRPLAFWRALGQAGLQLLSPAVLFSRRKRAKQWGFFRAVLSSWKSR